MPTINKYVDEDGYYILARPPGVGNITYKIEHEGNPVVWKHGLRDGDEVSWSTIQSFKALGIIYTDQSGTLGPDDFRPDPDQLEKTELPESEAEELFSIITTQFNLSPAESAEIRTILGLPPEQDFELVGDQIRAYLEDYVDSEGLAVGPDRTVTDVAEVDITTWVNETGSEDFDTWELHLLIIPENGDEAYFTDHCIHLCEKHGLEQWHIRVPEQPSWDIKRVAIVQRSVIFPRLLDELRAVQFDLGDPSEMLAPLVERFENGSA
ncbi:hypothetical protein [Halovivax limisalsi]|uniref:hypothetical protein n=1 Tax=Halovivax limisalsi TaxID=1453760 RepID=UPI001FFCD869|nr:hypothetical protein [Halovivax limisalsi]